MAIFAQKARKLDEVLGLFYFSIGSLLPYTIFPQNARKRDEAIKKRDSVKCPVKFSMVISYIRYTGALTLENFFFPFKASRTLPSSKAPF